MMHHRQHPVDIQETTMNSFVYVDVEKCTGCKACEVACAVAHNGEKYPRKRMFLPRIRAFNEQGLRASLACRHCEDAPCLFVCTVGAISKKDNAIVLDEKKCVGCKACLLACPFGVIQTANPWQAEQGASPIYKCDLCTDRKQGQACISACPQGAMQLMNDAAVAEIHRARQSMSLAALARLASTPGTVVETSDPFAPAVRVPRKEADKISIEQRTTTFTETYKPFTQADVTAQAGRCLDCGSFAMCRWTCPLHNNIPRLLKLAAQGRIIEAAELSHSTSSLPEVCGRVCPQDRLCEGSCVLGQEYGPVAIGNIEKFITDTAFAKGWKPDMSGVKPNGRRVAIIGSGPAGLSCADILARHGTKVVVFERQHEIGGMLTFGIPSFKLDKDVLINRRRVFTEMGIEFRLGCNVGEDITPLELEKEFDAIYVGVGVYSSVKARVPNESAAGVYRALSFLIANTKNLLGLPQRPSEPFVSMQGKRVVVLGGGDTAMDCVRTSIRQGAASVTCAYRRDEKNMPGSKKEVKNAREEGVEFLFNVQPQQVEINDKGEACGITFVRTELGAPDASGRRRPVVMPGSEFTLEAEAIVMAFGFNAHSLSWLDRVKVNRDRWGLVSASYGGEFPNQTSNPKFFAGGDIVRGADLVVTSMADGRRAARSILNYLGVAVDMQQAKP